MKREFDLSSLQRSILFGSLAFGILGFVLPIYGKQAEKANRLRPQP
jgi:hypothetical protein